MLRWRALCSSVRQPRVSHQQPAGGRSEAGADAALRQAPMQVGSRCMAGLGKRSWHPCRLGASARQTSARAGLHPAPRAAPRPGAALLPPPPGPSSSPPSPLPWTSSSPTPGAALLHVCQRQGLVFILTVESLGGRHGTRGSWRGRPSAIPSHVSQSSWFCSSNYFF